MVNLAALILILTSSTTPQQALPVTEPPHVSQTQGSLGARQLTPEQKAWFAHAIDHILEGK